MFQFFPCHTFSLTYSLSFSVSLSVMVSLMEEREPLWITGYLRGICRKQEIIRTRCAVYPRATATLPSSFADGHKVKRRRQWVTHYIEQERNFKITYMNANQSMLIKFKVAAFSSTRVTSLLYQKLQSMFLFGMYFHKLCFHKPCPLHVDPNKNA